MTALAWPSGARWKDGGPALLGVVAAHSALVAAVLIGLNAPVAFDVAPPTLAGVLVSEAPPDLAPPPPVPRPKPQPAKPRPALPAVKAPPTERSIAVPDTPPEDAPIEPVVDVPAPPAPPAPAAPPVTAPVQTGSPPVAPPLANAGHLNNPAPVYPEQARRRGEQGTVQIALLVLADGTVGDIGLARSSGYRDLDESALKAVARWRFVPASRAGVPIDFRYVLPVNFNLRR